MTLTDEFRIEADDAYDVYNNEVYRLHTAVWRQFTDQMRKEIDLTPIMEDPSMDDEAYYFLIIFWSLYYNHIECTPTSSTPPVSESDLPSFVFDSNTENVLGYSLKEMLAYVAGIIEGQERQREAVSDD